MIGIGRLMLVLAALAVGSSASAQMVVLIKGQRFLQQGDAAPTLATAEGPYEFNAFIEGADGFSGAVLVKPGGGTEPFVSDWGELFVENQYTTSDALQMAYPDGNYTVRLTPTGGGAPTEITLALSGGTFAPAPRFKNTSGLGQVDASAPLTLEWYPYDGASGGDFILVEVESEMMDDTVFFSGVPPEGLTAAATSITIPAGTFQDGTEYSVRLMFFRVTDMIEPGTGALPDAMRVAMYQTMTEVRLRTTGDQPTLGKLFGLVATQAKLGAPQDGVVTIDATQGIRNQFSIGVDLHLNPLPQPGAITFNGPTGGPFVNTPAENISPGDDFTLCFSPPVQIPPNPPAGNYSATFDGETRSEYLDLDSVFTLHPVMVPRIYVTNGLIDRIEWTVMRWPTFTPETDFSHIDHLQVRVNSWSGMALYRNDFVPVGMTSVDLSGLGIPWAMVNDVMLQCNGAGNVSWYAMLWTGHPYDPNFSLWQLDSGMRGWRDTSQVVAGQPGWGMVWDGAWPNVYAPAIGEGNAHWVIFPNASDTLYNMHGYMPGTDQWIWGRNDIPWYWNFNTQQWVPIAR